MSVTTGEAASSEDSAVVSQNADLVLSFQDDFQASLEIAAQSIVLPISNPETFGDFWWLRAGVAGSANFEEAWRYATGHGVSVGIVDNGVNHRHLDLEASYSRDLDFDPQDDGADTDAHPDTASEGHGTNVAGMIVGAIDNDFGGFGGASDATVAASYIRYGSTMDLQDLARVISSQAAFDVSNNSWQFRQAFADNFLNSSFSDIKQEFADAVTNGRDGLGTVFVFGAGNSKLVQNGQNIGDDANFHNFTNSRYSIAVGAVDGDGNSTYFSSPGANLLLSAPGIGLVTSDGTEDGSTGTAYVSGTSFATPLVSSAIALMLEANPDLGYRDVQAILAITASPSDAAGAFANAAHHFNGGGLVFDREMGFGNLDAAAAVNLARNWQHQSTAHNEASLDLVMTISAAPDVNMETMTASLAPGDERTFALEAVELTLTLYDADLRDLSIQLVSPSGTRSVVAENLTAAGNRTYLNFTFTSVVTRGEDAFGDWTLELSHPDGSRDFGVYRADLKFYGAYETVDDVHYFSDAFAHLSAADQARHHIEDHDGGDDTLNFVAADAKVVVDLSRGAPNSLGQVAFFLDSDFENVIGTTRDDLLTGSASDNRLVGDYGDDTLSGGDGNDTLLGGDGADILVGGDGDDVLVGGSGTDRAVYAGDFADYDIARTSDGYVVIDRSTGGTDLVSGVEQFEFGGQVGSLDGDADAIVSAMGPAIVAIASADGHSPNAQGVFEIVGSVTDGAILAVVTAHDVNLAFGDTLDFCLVGPEGAPYSGPFEIVKTDATTAALRVAQQTQVAAGDTYVCLVKVTDSSGNSITTHLLLEVAENAAPSGITFVENPSVDENADGAIASSPIVVTDPDAGSVFTPSSFTVSDNRFEIAQFGPSLVLKLKDGVSLDYESGEVSIDIDVTVTDAGGLSYQETVTIDVNDVNEGAIGGVGDLNVSMEQASTQTPLGLAINADTEGDTRTFTVTLLPAAGTVFLDGVAVTLGVVLSEGQFSRLAYSSPVGASGTFSMQLSVDDGNGNIEPFNVDFNVTPGVNSTLVGDGGANRLDGAFGDDTLEGGAGADTLIGGIGTDTVIYLNSGSRVQVRLSTGQGLDGEAQGDTYSGIENVIGSQFDDVIVGSEAAGNVLQGNGGADTIIGRGGADTLNGGDNNDLLDGGTGADTLIGGAGTDTASFLNSTTGVQVRLSTGHGLGGEAQGDTYSGIENVIGSQFGDTIVGDDANANLLQGYGGDDVLLGRGGNDRLEGGNANDLLDGGTGADTLIGGSGIDTVSYFGAAAGVQVRLSTGQGLDSDAQGDTYSGIENVIGSQFGDTIVGDDATGNVVQGNGGNDSILGRGGNDVITGGLGKDTLLGGLGDDTFVFASAADSSVGAQRDVVFDFEDVGDNDTLDFSGFAGVLSFIGSDAFSGANQVRAVQMGADVLVEINTTGPGGAESEILLTATNLSQVDASDFIL